MVSKSFTPEQIINKLREAKIQSNQGISIAEASRKIGVTQQTHYRWRKEYGGLRMEQILTQYGVNIQPRLFDGLPTPAP
jgi:putative transposase